MSDTNSKHVDTEDADAFSVSPFQAGLKCRCPRCGEGALYDGVLQLRDVCPVCGFDMQAADPGDGAIVFVILILGALVTMMSLWVEFTFHPPIWVHAALWPAVILGLTVWMLRVFKAMFVALQFRNDAHEGQMDESADD